MKNNGCEGNGIRFEGHWVEADRIILPQKIVGAKIELRLQRQRETGGAISFLHLTRPEILEQNGFNLLGLNSIPTRETLDRLLVFCGIELTIFFPDIEGYVGRQKLMKLLYDRIVLQGQGQ